jgi:hypothetical protein
MSKLNDELDKMIKIEYDPFKMSGYTDDEGESHIIGGPHHEVSGYLSLRVNPFIIAERIAISDEMVEDTTFDIITYMKEKIKTDIKNHFRKMVLDDLIDEWKNSKFPTLFGFTTIINRDIDERTIIMNSYGYDFITRRLLEKKEKP